MLAYLTPKNIRQYGANSNLVNASKRTSDVLGMLAGGRVMFIGDPAYLKMDLVKPSNGVRAMPVNPNAEGVREILAPFFFEDQDEVTNYVQQHPLALKTLQGLPERIGRFWEGDKDITLGVLHDPSEGTQTLVARFIGSGDPEEDANRLSNIEDEIIDAYPDVPIVEQVVVFPEDQV